MIRTAVAALATVFAAAGPALAQVDDASAQALLKKSDCGKCHAADKKKDGPSYKETAAKYKGKATAEADIVKHISTATKVKVDGKEEEHKPVKSTNEAEIKNLARWILSR